MRSRVMPGSLVTMERRVPVKRLKSVDLPTLGRPTITRDGRRADISSWAGRTMGAAACCAIFQCSAFRVVPEGKRGRASGKRREVRPVLRVVWFSLGGAEFNGLAMRGVEVGIGPGFFASEERRRIGEALCGEQALEGGEPVVIIMRAIVGFAAIGGGLEFTGEGGRPFLPGEMALLGE